MGPHFDIDFGNRNYVKHASAIHPVRSNVSIIRQPNYDTLGQGHSPAPSATSAPYPHYAPGIYEAECVSAKSYRDRQFKSWKVCLRFRLLPDGQPVSGYYHLGRGEKPHAGPRSEYLRAWIIANGGLPTKRQVLSARTFEGKLFSVRVADVKHRYDGREHPAEAVYSTVHEIMRRTYP